jgi:hypothetical protein
MVTQNPPGMSIPLCDKRTELDPTTLSCLSRVQFGATRRACADWLDCVAATFRSAGPSPTAHADGSSATP